MTYLTTEEHNEMVDSTTTGFDDSNLFGENDHQDEMLEDSMLDDSDLF